MSCVSLLLTPACCWGTQGWDRLCSLRCIEPRWGVWARSPALLVFSDLVASAQLGVNGKLSNRATKPELDTLENSFTRSSFFLIGFRGCGMTWNAFHMGYNGKKMKLQPLYPSESWANGDILLIPCIQPHVVSVHVSNQPKPEIAEKLRMEII